MGLFSEIAASHNAAFLKSVLDSARQTDNKEIIEFCHKHLYDRFKSEKSEAWESVDAETIAFWEGKHGSS